MLRVEYPLDGMVLSRLDGTESAEGLRITVRGRCDASQPVTVNGKTATQSYSTFSAEVLLTARSNDIRVSSGSESVSLQVLWDKASFPRYNFYIDDHSFVYTDIAQARPKSLFDHFYLKGLRAIHRRYGTKFTLNSFFRNDHHGFLLSDFPTCYRSEWEDNADWLRMSFHAYSEFPDRCYEKPEETEQMLKDFVVVKDEICRFAGEQSFIQPVVIHWAVVSERGVAALVKNGMKVFSGGFRGVKADIVKAIAAGRNPLVDGLDNVDMKATSDIGYYLTHEDAIKVQCLKKWYDKRTGALFFGGSGICCNLYTPAQIKANFAETFALPYPNEVYGLATHEQYTYPYYRNYIPDHLARIDLSCRIVTEERGAKPVFASEGLLGNTSWGM